MFKLLDSTQMRKSLLAIGLGAALALTGNVAQAGKIWHWRYRDYRSNRRLGY